MAQLASHMASKESMTRRITQLEKLLEAESAKGTAVSAAPPSAKDTELASLLDEQRSKNQELEAPRLQLFASEPRELIIVMSHGD